MKRMASLIVAVIVIVATTAFAGKLTVNYLSAEHVYINGGAADGLIAGTRLKVMRGKTALAELEVIFAAQHSASCRIISNSGTIESGDAVVVLEEAKQTAKSTPIETSVAKPTDSLPSAASPAPSVGASPRKASRPAVNGSMAYMYTVWNDASATNHDYSQSAFRLSLNARRLFGTELAFHFRGRTRNDWRRSPFGTPSSSDEWKNQIWEFSFSYEDPTSPVKLYGGRILPQRVGRIGYLDGLLTEVRLSETYRVGLFGGVRPDLLYAENPQSLSIGGGYVAYVTRIGDSLLLEQSIAGVGEYQNAVISRESISLSGRLQKGNTWGVSQSVEFDINRRWREIRSGSTIVLSNVYASGWTRLSRAARATISYDNRTNYRTLQNRSIADSVFDDHLYQGARLMLESSLPWHCRLSGSVGMRKRPDRDQPTWSWMGSFRASRCFIDGLSFSSQLTAYNGSRESGRMFSASFNKTVGNSSSVGVTYGGYSYSNVAVESRPQNNWVELTGQTDVARHWFLSGWLQSDFGDDMDGFRTQMEIGYRF